jgi:hypothetical protein
MSRPFRRAYFRPTRAARPDTGLMAGTVAMRCVGAGVGFALWLGTAQPDWYLET